MNNMTTITKGPGGWSAKTSIPLGAGSLMHHEGERKLEVHTYKYSHGVATFASCSLHKADGVVIHAICGDYCERVAQAPVRCTEKSVREHHAGVLANIDQIKAKALAFYAAKEAKEDLHARRERELAQEDAIKQAMLPQNNPAQTLTVGLLDALAGKPSAA